METAGGFAGHVHDRRAVHADGDRDRLPDLLSRGAQLERLLDVPLKAAVAARDQAGGDRDQLLRLPVEGGGLVRLLVEPEVELAKTRVEHAVGPGLLRWERRTVVVNRIFRLVTHASSP